MVNLQDTPTAGPLTVADLDEARKHSTGRIWHSPHRLLPSGCSQQGRYQTREWAWPDTIATDYSDLDSCAVEGGKHREPSSAMESMLRYRRITQTVQRAVGLVIAVAVASYIVRTFWPLAA